MFLYICHVDELQIKNTGITMIVNVPQPCLINQKNQYL